MSERNRQKRFEDSVKAARERQDRELSMEQSGLRRAPDPGTAAGGVPGMGAARAAQWDGAAAGYGGAGRTERTPGGDAGVLNGEPVAQVFPGESPAELLGRTGDGMTPEGLAATGEAAQAIGKKELSKAREILTRYRAGKNTMDQRIVENEKWWRMQHMGMVAGKIKRASDTPSGWLFNSLANKHADAMDNYPTPSVLPREAGDRMDAEALSSVLPVILEQNDFEQVYDETWQYKLKSGTGCYGVFWNTRKLGGLGDIDIKRVDVLNLYWEPRVSDIQDSRNLFYVYTEDNDSLRQKYPQLEERLGERDFTTVQYAYEDSDTQESEKSTVIDWYYKKWQDGREVLHYCKFCGETVLYATENEEAMRDRGIYDHGQYPFVLDIMFKIEGSPAGFGYIDVMKGAQTRIDRLQNAIAENALEASNNRWFIRDGASINEEEFMDHGNKLVHVAGEVSDENVRQITVPYLTGNYLTILESYVNELKEVSGNRDVSNGGTTSGVTAASAIAAMQEAGSKLSRDMIKASYRAFSRVCNLIIENIRQFYTEARTFRIIGEDGTEKFIQFSNQRIALNTRQGAFGMEESRLPVFDVVVKAQKANPYSRISQNELAKEFFAMGFFDPANTDRSLACLRMMDFDGKQELIQNIEKNGTMYDRFIELQAQAAKLAAIVDREHGTQILQGMVQQGLIDGGSGGAAGPVSVPAGKTPTVDSLGKEMGTNSITERARMEANEATAPR